jgi:hypothetical protein
LYTYFIHGNRERIAIMERIGKILPFIAATVSAGTFLVVTKYIEIRFFWWFVPIVLIAIWVFGRYTWSFLGVILFSIAAGDVDLSLDEKQVVIWVIVICGAIQVLIAFIRNLIRNRMDLSQAPTTSTLGRNTLFGFFGMSIAYALIYPRCTEIAVPPEILKYLPAQLLNRFPLLEGYLNTTYCLGDFMISPISNMASSSETNINHVLTSSLACIKGIHMWVWPFLFTSIFAALSQTLPPNFRIIRFVSQTLKALGGMILISFVVVFLLSTVVLLSNGLITIFYSAASDSPGLQTDILFRVMDFVIIIVFAVCILLYAFGAGWGARWWIHKWEPVQPATENSS